MRYYDELPRAARTAFRNAVGLARDAAFCSPILDAFGCIGIKSLDILKHTTALADRALYELHRLEGDGTQVVVRILFGTESVNEVIALASDVFEETEFLNKGRQDRIVARIADGTHSQGDVDWMRDRAHALTDDQILEMRPFDGDESEAKELSRKVVRGRTPHTCHWTRATIAPGERHLVLKEVVEGEFLTTRHSLLAVYLDVVGEDPGLASHLAPKPETEVAA